MLEKPNIADSSIARHLRDLYRVEAHGIVFLAVGADPGAAAYRIEADGHSFFLKLRHTMSDDILSLARFLADDRRTQVVGPLQARNGRLSSRLDGWTAALYPFIDGVSGFEQSFTHAQWTALGSAVRTVHDAKPPAEVRDSLRAEDFSSMWRDRVRAHLSSSKQGGDAVAKKLAATLDARRDQIKTIVDRSEDLARVVRTKSLPKVLCHGDLHGGNVMVSGDGSLAIIDWDDPVVAPKEKDLMFIGGGVGGTWNSKPETDAFYGGYGSTAIDADALAYYRYERIVEDIAVFSDELLLSNAGGMDRALSLRYFMDAFRPHSVVEIADRTYGSLSTPG